MHRFALVSQVELKTKTVGEDLGTLIRIEGNEVKEISKTSFERGTSISVKNLFYNTPGRRNFLKSDPTEFRHIYDTFIKLAISFHDKFFKLINNDNIVFNLKPDNLHGRLKDIFTEDFANTLIPVDSTNNLIGISRIYITARFYKKNETGTILISKRQILHK